MKFINSFKVGNFLAWRSIRRGNKYVTVLIIIILTLIFLNLVALGGLLIGLVKGSEVAYIKDLSGTMVVEPKTDKKFIKNADKIIDFLKTLPDTEAYAPRLSSGAKMETNFKERKIGSLGETVGATIMGIDPELEASTTRLSQQMIEGRYLREDDRQKIILGAIVAGRGATISIGEALKEVYIGDKILVTYGNGVRREYELVGIFKSKANLRNLQAFVPLKEMNDVMGVKENTLTQIAIRTKNPMEPYPYKKYFTDAGYDKDNLLKTWDDALGSFINDLNTSFNLIADIVGGIGLAVGGITIFILIFVNAVSKRRFIGVLKASGITKAAIIISYVLQGVFYTVIAVTLGCIALYGFLVPYYDKNPVVFPFADGIIYVSQDYLVARMIIMMVVAVISGFVPAYIIARENTLNAILGR